MPAVVMPNTADWLTELAGVPLPLRSQEDWRFTDLAALQALAPELWIGADPFGELSLPAGISLIGADEAQVLQQQGLKATGGGDAWSVLLNQGASPRCLALRVAGAAGPLQLHLDAGTAPGLLALQLVLVLEEGASLELLIQHGSSGPNATSLVTVAQLARGAQLNLGLLALFRRVYPLSAGRVRALRRLVAVSLRVLVECLLL